MKSGASKLLAVLTIFGVTAGCKFELVVPSGGRVIAEHNSGEYNCPEATVCTIEISDPNFAETWAAIPNSGWTFIKWQEGDDFLCGGSTNPICSFSLVGSPFAALTVAYEGTQHAMPIFRINQTDTDGDGIPNFRDTDDDNDGVLDPQDVYPLDKTRSTAETGLAHFLREETKLVGPAEGFPIYLNFAMSFYSIDGREGEYAALYVHYPTYLDPPIPVGGDKMYFTSWDCDGSSGNVYLSGNTTTGLPGEPDNAGALIVDESGRIWMFNTPGETLEVSGIASVRQSGAPFASCLNQFNLNEKYTVSHAAQVFIQ